MVNNNIIESEELLNELIRYSKKELLFKFVVIGDFGVGKTSIIKRYTEGTFSTNYKITIGADFAIKKFEFDEYTRIILQLWDIAGYERFGSLTSVYYRYSVAAAIVFDLTRPETFKSIKKWLTDLRSKVLLPDNQQLPIVLLANKGDINTDNLPPQIIEFCKKNNILAWFITSAKDNINIDNAMHTLIKEVINNYNTENCKSSSNDTIVLSNEQKDKHKFYRQCCQQ